MKPMTMIGLVIAFIFLILLSSSVYTVSEGERAIVLRLGKIEKNAKTGQAKIMAPGIHFKTPFITTVHYFNVRLRDLNVESSRILTAEQKYVLVDYFAKWRIENIPLYFTRTRGNSRQAQQLLEQKINDALRAAFGKREIKEVISSARLNVMALLREKADQSAQTLGISVVDVRIQGIDLPSQVRDSVFQRMRTQREQVATKFRAEGQAQAETIRAGADANVAVTVATAKTKAQEVRAEGDSEAAHIYAKAYNKNPGFYAFYRSLVAYQQVFGHQRNTIMVLKPSSAFLKYFNRQP